MKPENNPIILDMPKKDNRKKIMLATIVYDVGAIPYGSHLAMAYRAAKDLPDWDFHICGPHRLPIDKGRNMAVEAALVRDCDYIMFYDDDMVMHPHIIKILFLCEH